MTWEELINNPEELANLANKITANGIAKKYNKSNHKAVTHHLKKRGYIYINKQWVKADGEDKIKQGQEEKKPRYIENDEGYRIYYGRNERYHVDITEERLEEALGLYCVAHLNQEQTGDSVGLTRREFHAVKTAFDIVKSSMPFTPKQIDKYTADELAEKYRAKKKHYALKKFEKNKNVDIEKRIKEMDKVHFWHKEICKNVNQIDPEPFQVRKKKLTSEEIYVVYNTDVHAGLEVDNYFNTYNIDIMHERFKTLAQGIINNVFTQKLYIVDLGDTVHGIIHGSVQKYSKWVTGATTEVIKAYENLFLTLIQEGYEIYFAKVNGSHESIEKEKTSRTEEENFGNLIFDMLQWKYQNFKSLHFIPKLKNLNVVVLPLFDYSTLLIHGDENSMSRIKDADRLFHEHNVKEINAGHFHHRKCESYNGLTIFYNEAFCGAEQYSSKKMLVSEPGTRLVQYTPEGRGVERLIRY